VGTEGALPGLVTGGRGEQHSGRGWLMDKREADPSGDYGYDLAHDVPRREQAGAHRDPARPGSRAHAPTTGDRGQDYEYDEAHDF
jgi:hypothetical protein